MLHVASLKSRLTLLRLNNCRGLRTRINFKVDPKLKQELKDKEERHDSQLKKELSNHFGDTNIKKALNIRRRRSKVSGIGNDEDWRTREVMNMINFKSPERIKKELEAKFKEDGVEIDQKFITKMIELSKRQQEETKKFILNPENTQNDVTRKQLIQYVDWLIDDAYERLENNLSYEIEDDKLTQKLNENLQYDEENEQDNASMLNVIKTLGDLTTNKLKQYRNSLKMLPEFLSRISLLRNYELAKSIPFEKWLELYSISSKIQNSALRHTCVYYSGEMIFRYLENGQRMDITNERTFIHALLHLGKNERAWEVYAARTPKAYGDNRFWFELGAEIQLRLGNVNDAIEMIEKINEKYHYVDPDLFLTGIDECIKNGNRDDLMWFWEELAILIQNFGMIPQAELKPMRNFAEACDVLNEKRPVEYDRLLKIIFLLMSKQLMPEGMEALQHCVNYDPEFMFYIIQWLKNEVDSIEREIFLQEWLADKKLDKEVQSVYIPIVRDYLIEQVQQMQPERTIPLNEIKFLHNVDTFLGRLVLLHKSKRAEIQDLRDSIERGQRLNNFETTQLMNLCLEGNTNKGVELATELLTILNFNLASETLENTTFPKANSHVYGVFIENFLNASRPKISVIEQTLQIMENSGIQIKEQLAQKIVTKLVSQKKYATAFKFIEKYVMTDNDISVKKIKIGKQGEKSLWTACLSVFYKSMLTIVDEPEAIRLRHDLLKVFVKRIIDNRVNDKLVVGEVLGAFFAFGDLASCIAFLKWHSKTFGGKIHPDVYLILKAKLETRITKADRRLDDKQRMIIKPKLIEYRDRYGLVTHIKKDLQPLEIDEVVETILQFGELFGYDITMKKNDPFSIGKSDAQKLKDKVFFDQSVDRACKQFGL